MKSEYITARPIVMNVLAGLLFYAWKNDLSDGCFDALHWTLMLVSSFYGFEDYKQWKEHASQPHKLRAIVLLASAIAFNPIAPLRFDSQTWETVNVLFAITYIVTEVGLQIFLLTAKGGERAIGTVSAPSDPNNKSFKTKTYSAQLSSFLLQVLWNPALLAFILIVNHGENDRSLESLTERILICSLWFIPPALALRFLFVRRQVTLGIAIFSMVLCWFSFAAMYRAFDIESATLDMAGDTVHIVIAAVPYAGPIICTLLISNEHYQMQKLDEWHPGRDNSLSKRGPAPVIGFMAAIFIAIVRWRPSAELKEPKLSGEDAAVIG